MRASVGLGVLAVLLLLTAPASASPGGGYRDTTLVVWDLAGESIEFEVAVNSPSAAVALGGDRFAWTDKHSRRDPTTVFVKELGSEAGARPVATISSWVRGVHFWGEDLFVHSIDFRPGPETRNSRIKNIDKVDLATGQVERVLQDDEFMPGFTIGGPYVAWTVYWDVTQHEPFDLYVYNLVEREWVFHGISPAELGLTHKISLAGVTEDWLIAEIWTRPSQSVLYSFHDGSVRNISHAPQYWATVSVADDRIINWDWKYFEEDPPRLGVESVRLEDGEDRQEHEIVPWPTLRGLFTADGTRAILYTGELTWFAKWIPGASPLLIVAIFALMAGIARRGGVRSPECRDGRRGR